MVYCSTKVFSLFVFIHFYPSDICCFIVIHIVLSNFAYNRMNNDSISFAGNLWNAVHLGKRAPIKTRLFFRRTNSAWSISIKFMCFFHHWCLMKPLNRTRSIKDEENETSQGYSNRKMLMFYTRFLHCLHMLGKFLRSIVSDGFCWTFKWSLSSRERFHFYNLSTFQGVHRLVYLLFHWDWTDTIQNLGMVAMLNYDTV